MQQRLLIQRPQSGKGFHLNRPSEIIWIMNKFRHIFLENPFIETPFFFYYNKYGYHKTAYFPDKHKEER